MAHTGLGHILTTISKTDPETGIESLFTHDNDFTENKEYFRPDTISLGFENEALRIAREETEKLGGKEITEADIKRIIEDKLISSSSYYDESDIEIIDLEKEFVVSVAYTTYV